MTVNELKVELFDILVEQDKLNYHLEQLEKLKREKLEELRKLTEGAEGE